MRVRQLIIDGLEKHKNLTYEERCRVITENGLKINVGKLKFLYKKLTIAKEIYKENKNSDYVKNVSVMT